MFTRIDHMALIVRDRHKSIKFYEDNFGFVKYFENDASVPAIEKIVYLRLGETILELVHMKKGAANSGYHFCLHSDDFEQDYNSLVQKGIEVEAPARPTGARTEAEQGWKRAVFKGPDGESIEIRG